MECLIPDNAGVYKLTCNINNKIYIGKSVNIRRRMYQHKNCRDGGFLHNAIQKHGWDNFKLDIIEIFENFDRLNDNLYLLDREAYYIEFYDSTNRDRGYNRSKYSSDTTGLPVSDETREKQRISATGNTNNLGRIPDNITREKMRNAKLGKSNLACVGKPRTEETKQKIRDSKRGKKLSEEHKRKISESGVGRVVSAETRQKIKDANVGFIRGPMSEEHKEKIRLANLGKHKKHIKLINE